MSWLLSFVLAGTVSHGSATSPIAAPPRLDPTAARSAEALLHGPWRRIRSSEGRIKRLLADGIRRSKTFADLVSRIHETDVIVYVESSPNLGPETVGRMQLQTVAAGQRYLRVQIRSLLAGDQVIAILAHELHHALEVAADTSVVDDATLTELYKRIGRASHKSHAFDTDGARAAGIRVRDELIG